MDGIVWDIPALQSQQNTSTLVRQQIGGFPPEQHLSETHTGQAKFVGPFGQTAHWLWITHWLGTV